MINRKNVTLEKEEIISKFWIWLASNGYVICEDTKTKPEAEADVVMKKYLNDREFAKSQITPKTQNSKPLFQKILDRASYLYTLQTGESAQFPPFTQAVIKALTEEIEKVS